MQTVLFELPECLDSRPEQRFFFFFNRITASAEYDDTYFETWLNYFFVSFVELMFKQYRPGLVSWGETRVTPTVLSTLINDVESLLQRCRCSALKKLMKELQEIIICKVAKNYFCF